ncbi:MAG: AMP-binding protein [Bacteroidales bacterium]|nr:AMP-binding protein [Bacteroidales bacterium]MDY0347495.1 AMP-binding protein [Tenuifilaceae bacterium]
MINVNDVLSIALVTKDNKYSYGDLLQMIEGYALLFRGKGYKKIAIYSENRVEWIAAFYAGWRNSCVVVPVDYMASVNDVAYILNDCKPELVFTSPLITDKIQEVVPKLQYSPQIHTFSVDKFTPVDSEVKWTEPEDIEKTAVIIYTSGTTGSPKGVMLSYKNLIANLDGVSKDVEIYKKDRQVLMLLPLHHVFPLAGSMLVPLYVGATIVMAASLQSSDLFYALNNNKIAILIGVPKLYEIISKGVKAKVEASFIGRQLYRIVKFSGSKKLATKVFKKVHDNFGGNLQFLVSGGAALPKHVGSVFKTLGFDVLEGYGMTEAAPMITFTRPGKVRIGSPGQSLPRIEMQIRDGEIVAKGDNIMQGYYNRPEETAEVLKDGWLYTGDLGRIDRDGFLYITGRKKDIIILSNGKNINPVEIEIAFEKAFDEVAEAGVFLHNNYLHLAILPNLEKLAELNVQDVRAYFKSEIITRFNANLSPHMRILKFAIVDTELPRTRLGKIQRFKLAEHAQRKPRRKQVEVNYHPTEYFMAVKSYIETQIDFDIQPSHHVEFDLGLDSLNKLGLIDYIERSFGVKMDEKKLTSFPSLSHMADYIKEKKKWFREETSGWAETLKEKVDIKLPKSWPTHNIFKNFAKYFFKIYFRFTGEGVENIPEGPCIITPNHQSFIDGLLVATFLKRKVFKQTYFYAKKKHVNNKFLRFLARTNNVIVVDVEGDLKDSIQQLAAALKEGRKIIIFPEGTRSTTGELGEFKKTFAILSTELNVPVVPVVIEGADKALPVGAKIPRPWKRVEVKFLKPVNPEGYTAESMTEGVHGKIEEVLSNKSK